MESRRSHQQTTFGTLGHGDDAVWEVHKHIKQVGSVAHFWIYKPCDIACGKNSVVVCE